MNPVYTTLGSINLNVTAYTAFRTLENILNNVTLNEINKTATTLATIHEDVGPPKSPYNTTQMVMIAIVATILSLLTVIGNFMVMISFKIDKQLQTISNYFLFSLAIADFAIGLISMPLFTVSTILGHWPLGPIVCDTWLALDYLASNASVLNLLIISFDRYFSVTRPLTYRAKRTTNRAAIMIASAWGISLLLWPPWIYSWPYIEGKRTVPEYACYIQFIETNHYITFGTAIAAFYLPVTVMCILYYRIWRETKKRQKDLPNLQGGGGGASIKKDSSKRSNSSDETSTINHQIDCIDSNNAFWHPPHDMESNSYYSSGHPHSNQSRRPSTKHDTFPDDQTFLECVQSWCVAWWHSGQEEECYEDYNDWYDGENDQSYAEYSTPCSADTPVQSSVSRCTSLNIIRDPYARSSYCPSTSNDSPASCVKNRQHNTAASAQITTVTNRNHERTPPSNLKRSLSSDSVYTILIRLPIEGTDTRGMDGYASGGEKDTKLPSIKMFPEETQIPKIMMTKQEDLTGAYSTLKKGEKDPFAIGMNMPHKHPYELNRLPLNAKVVPKKKPLTHREKQQKVATAKKRKTQEKRQETKAAKTLSAILLSFIITWTPYNILVLLKPLTTCINCIPQELWDCVYALCYLNSTINPVCYALCNASFRRTYVRILTCKWHNRNREGISRGVYN